ncbi:A disintegrin and metalloproteinase with thrombospondin motifs 1-like [Aphidius gifuensis]|nr:A disintegrin and metalloproteinase with thrombospondin motifs 1-like [Aphidius gifuensis]
MNTPIWFAKGNSSSNVEYTRLDNDTLHDALKFYEDPNNMAEVIVIRSDKRGSIEFIMHIRDRSSQLTVFKAPSSVVQKWKEFFKKSKNSRVSRSAETQFVQDYHIAINLENVEQSYKPIPNPVKRSQAKKKIESPPYTGPDPIYIRILLFINYGVEYVSESDLHLYKFLIYLVSFWNAVNLKFNDFVNPSVRLHISGVVIGNNKLAAPYLQDSFEPNGKYVDSNLALLKFRDFLRQKNQQKIMNLTWDIAITQTDLKLCYWKNVTHTASNVGLAHVGQTCNNENSDDSPVAIIHDSNNFRGIFTAAHEIAHVLGAVHDGSGNNSCPQNGSFIMQSNNGYVYGPNSDTWSSCSIDEILTVFKNKCWSGNSLGNENVNIPDILPGHMVSLLDQCQSRKFTNACDESKTTCEKLYCWNDSDLPNFLDKCINAGAPLSGTYCGVKKHCINQKCVPIIDDNIL